MVQQSQPWCSANRGIHAQLDRNQLRGPGIHEQDHVMRQTLDAAMGSKATSVAGFLHSKNGYTASSSLYQVYTCAGHHCSDRRTYSRRVSSLEGSSMALHFASLSPSLSSYTLLCLCPQIRAGGISLDAMSKCVLLIQVFASKLFVAQLTLMCQTEPSTGYFFWLSML